MKRKKLTAAHVWAMFAETEKRFDEVGAYIKAVGDRVDNTTANVNKLEASFAETKIFLKEVGTRVDNTTANIDKLEARIDRTTANIDKLEARINNTTTNIDKLTANINKTDFKLGGVNSRLDGIAKSNGKFAEEYFFNSLEEKMEFAGIHFDEISDKFKCLKKMPDGSRLEDQFDIVMINEKTVAIIEVKYSADSYYPKEMVNRKVKNFRTLFPDYKDFDIYLGLGSMSFDDYVVKEAEKYGIGILKQVGDVIEYKTDWVRAY